MPLYIVGVFLISSNVSMLQGSHNSGTVQISCKGGATHSRSPGEADEGQGDEMPLQGGWNLATILDEAQLASPP